MKNDIVINGEQLKEIINSGEKVVVDFFAEWCGPCQMFKPIFTEMAEKESVRMVMINIDDEQQMAIQSGVQGVPTVQIYENGEKKSENVGFMSPEELASFIKK